MSWAARHPWAVRAVFAANCVALLATSEGPSGRYLFFADPPPTLTELTAETTTRGYRVLLRAEALGIKRTSTTVHPDATVSGVISSAGLETDAPTPYVSYAVYDPNSAESRQPLHTLTEFSTERRLKFTGDCQTFASTNPCEASFVVELSRADDGASGGTVNVLWSLRFRETADRYTRDTSNHELPWTIAVEEM